MRRFLIVDDNRAFGENLAEILIEAGAAVDLATGALSALEHVTSSRYDALISDMRMPLMGGAELVHRARRLDPGLPAMVITAYTNDDDLEAARHEGLLAVLPKPAPVQRLLDLCRTARRDGLVALVEDDGALSDNLSEALRERGFAAVTASSVLATERLGEVRLFAGIVDLRVPVGVDGLAMERLAQKFPGLPILVITGHDLVPTQPHHAVFRKPFDTAALLAEVERLHAGRHVQ